MTRVLLILCEGLTEKLYFDIIVRRRRIQKVKVEVVEIDKVESDVILKMKNRGKGRDKKYRKKQKSVS